MYLKNSSERPIYEQIKQQIKENILKGYVVPGEHLPSMRELALDLSVSVITTKRAYEDLEKDGFVFTIRGKICFNESVYNNCSDTFPLDTKPWVGKDPGTLGLKLRRYN